VRLGLVVKGEDGRPGLVLDDLSTTTHPLQHLSFELDRQETYATECVLVLVQFLQADPDLAIPSSILSSWLTV
jgi:hypothetical protein